MRVRLLLSALLLTLVAACATPFRSDVTRFHQLPAPGGQTFYIQPRDEANQGSLEFQQYASLVAQQLTAQGYRQASSPEQASLVVSLDYGVGAPQEKIATRPGTRSYWGGWGPWGYPYYGYPYWRPWRGYYGGWYDPFWSSPFWDEPEVYSYTVYNSYLSLEIKRAADGTSLFEGRAESTNRDNDLTEIMPKLVQAMFTDFPGRSGQTVQVKIDDKSRATVRG